MSGPTIAKTVVCDLTKTDKDVFMVDGKPFPWWIDEKGPQVTKLADDLYAVAVDILVVSATGNDTPETFHHDGFGNNTWPQPIINGIEFPWYISQDGFTYRANCRICPVVELAFFAQSVTGIEIHDEQNQDHTDGKIFDAAGYVIARR